MNIEEGKIEIREEASNTTFPSNCVGAVYDKDGEFCGTCFLIDKDHVATCAHVLKDRFKEIQPPENFLVYFN